MRVDLAFDAVKSCHQQRRIAEIWVAGSVRIADLKAAQVRRLGVSRNANDRAAVARGVTDGNGCLKAWHQTLKGVGRRVRDGAERGNMLQKAAHKPVRLLAEVRVTVVIGEHRLAVLQEQHVYVHAAASLTVDRLGHKGRGLAVLERRVADDVLDHHARVGHLAHLAKLRLDLKLTRAADLRVVVLDGNAGFFHVQAHLAAALIGAVKRLCDMVVTLTGNDHAAAVDVAVPVCLLGVKAHTDLVRRDLPRHIVEEIEFKLGQNEHGVGDAAVTHILLRRAHDVARILIERTVGRIVDDHGIAGHRERRDLAERVDLRGVRVRDKDHIALFDHSVAIVRGVETDAVGHGRLREILCRNGHVAVLAVDIDHFEVHHLDALLTNELHDLLCCFSHCNIPPRFFGKFSARPCRDRPPR